MDNIYCYDMKVYLYDFLWTSTTIFQSLKICQEAIVQLQQFLAPLYSKQSHERRENYGGHTKHRQEA